MHKVLRKDHVAETPKALKGRPFLQGQVNFPLCLAPMVGISHVASRLLMREYLPEGASTLWPTEMLSSFKIPKEDLSQTPEALRGPDEDGLCPQILGNDERCIALSVEKLEAWGAQAIDINMGCPVKKALSHNYGVALMGDASYAAEVVRMTVKHSTKPVSVKLRAVASGDFETLYDFVSGLRDAGASWVCLHPRTAGQMRRGQADWTQIRDLRSRVNFPVIGNGDVQTVDDVFDMLQETECDLVMVGRALTARPWLFWQVGERLGWASPPGLQGRLAPQGSREEAAEYGRALIRLTYLMEEYFKPDLALRKFRFFVKTGHVWLNFGLALYALTCKQKNFVEMRLALEEFFSVEQSLSARSELRQ